MEEQGKEPRLAVLIDSDNVSYSYVKAMMEEIARYGTPTIKRIYGDWTRSEASGWKNVLLENAIQPVQQYRYTVGKNATDSSLIIDAMDILYSERVDGFCIVSSDSDFTRLATRLREAGVLVIGIGEKKTPEPFTVACDRFIYLEILDHKDEVVAPSKMAKKPMSPAAKQPAQQSAQQPSQAKQAQQPKTKITLKLENFILTTVNDVADEDGWAYLGDVGNLLLRKQPSFDSRNYGYSKLSLLIKATGLFEIVQRDPAGNGNKQWYLRDKEFAATEKEP